MLCSSWLISPETFPLDCSRETIYYFRTSLVSKRLLTRTLVFANFLCLSIHQKNLWNQTSLILSRWLPRSPRQRENELYPPCCSQGRGGAAAASCKRGHSECQCLRSGEQLRCHCKSLLQCLNQYAREGYSNKSSSCDRLCGSCNTSCTARLALKYFHHLKAAWLRSSPRTIELEAVPLGLPPHLWENSVFQYVELDILVVFFRLRRLALISVKAALVQAVPKQPSDLRWTFYLLGLWLETAGYWEDNGRSESPKR